jgi:hypothetical protein
MDVDENGCARTGSALAVDAQPQRLSSNVAYVASSSGAACFGAPRPNVSMRLMSAPACSTASTAAMRLRRRPQWIIASTPPTTEATVSQGRYHGT